MTEKLSEKDLDDATQALIAWFESQSMTPTEGVMIMNKIIALQIADKYRDDVLGMTKACEKFSRALILELAIIHLKLAKK